MNAAKLEPEVGIYQFNIANLFKSLGQHVDADIFYKRAVEIEPKNAEFRTNYITFLEDVGAFTEAKHQVELGLNFNPKSPELKVNFGIHKFTGTTVSKWLGIKAAILEN